MLKTLCLIISLFAVFQLAAMPKIEVLKRIDQEGHSQVKVLNKTIRNLACYVAIDGQKQRFRLTGKNSSKWYKATNKTYNHSQFSVWCDYLEYHPNYQK